MKVRCPECDERIVVDEGFAGGVCRCPYCKALVFVPAKPGDKGGARPEAPGEPESAPPDRPDAPKIRQMRGRGVVVEAMQAPSASRLKLPGIIAMVLLGGVLAIAVAAITLLQMGSGEKARLHGEPPVHVRHEASDSRSIGSRDEHRIAGAGVADLAIEPPVVYLIDAGRSMQATYDLAAAIVRKSICTLQDDQRFNIIVCYGRERKMLGPRPHRGNESTYRFATEFMKKIPTPAGLTDLTAAMIFAIERKPKTIVLLARKPLGDIERVAEAAKRENVKITTISIASNEYATSTMSDLAAMTGGMSRRFSFAELEEWVRTVAKK